MADLTSPFIARRCSERALPFNGYLYQRKKLYWQCCFLQGGGWIGDPSKARARVREGKLLKQTSCPCKKRHTQGCFPPTQYSKMFHFHVPFRQFLELCKHLCKAIVLLAKQSILQATRVLSQLLLLSHKCNQIPPEWKSQKGNKLLSLCVYIHLAAQLI